MLDWLLVRNYESPLPEDMLEQHYGSPARLVEAGSGQDGETGQLAYKFADNEMERLEHKARAPILRYHTIESGWESHANR